MIFHSLFFANFDFPDRLCKGSALANPFQGCMVSEVVILGLSLTLQP